MKADAVMDTLVDALAEVEDKTVSNTLSDVKDQVVANNLADTLAEAGTVGQALSKVHAKVLMDQLPHMLPEIMTKTLVATLSDMEAKALVETLADTLPEAEADRHCETLGVVKVGVLSDPLANTQAERALDRHAVCQCKRIDTLAKRPSKVGAETLGDTLDEWLRLGTNRHAVRGRKRSRGCEAWKLIK